MKHSYVAFITLLICIGCGKDSMDGESTNSVNEERVEIKLTPTRLDTGKMPPSNVPLDLSFVIENIGETQFAVVDIMSSCGCTVVDIPKEPV